jgi:hypothetical protein
MPAPSIYGDPKITQDEKSGSVFLDVSVTGADPAKTKWFLGDKEIAATNTYKFSNAAEAGGRQKLRCEVKVICNWGLTINALFRISTRL